MIFKDLISAIDPYASLDLCITNYENNEEITTSIQATADFFWQDGELRPMNTVKELMAETDITLTIGGMDTFVLNQEYDPEEFAIVKEWITRVEAYYQNEEEGVLE